MSTVQPLKFTGKGGPRGFRSLTIVQFLEQSHGSIMFLAVVASIPVGGILLALAGFTLLATVVGLEIVTPLSIIFSPVLVPAAAVIGLGVAGFLTSRAFGLTGPVRYMYRPAMMHMEEMGGYVRQKTEEAGHQIQFQSGLNKGRPD
ncbi:hypothetical protein SAY86_014345 [Trapa natans]|uniref:Oleosin n=1 Tax=Trapa natans TaxID=22666 RepID=A0AAN7KZ05_TRANT|nr:hypothetical protein SAY86_014345 [Trapa natans]